MSSSGKGIFLTMHFADVYFVFVLGLFVFFAHVWIPWLMPWLLPIHFRIQIRLEWHWAMYLPSVVGCRGSPPSKRPLSLLSAFLINKPWRSINVWKTLVFIFETEFFLQCYQDYLHEKLEMTDVMCKKLCFPFLSLPYNHTVHTEQYPAFPSFQIIQ